MYITIYIYIYESTCSSVFNKFLWCTIDWSKELLILHSTAISLGQVVQLIMIMLSLTALTIC